MHFASLGGGGASRDHFSSFYATHLAGMRQMVSQATGPEPTCFAPNTATMMPATSPVWATARPRGLCVSARLCRS